MVSSVILAYNIDTYKFIFIPLISFLSLYRVRDVCSFQRVYLL
jgi:hypothetical protein